MLGRLKDTKIGKFKKPNKEPDIKRMAALSKAHLLVFTIIFAAIGGYLLLSSQAAGSPTPVPDANTNGVTVGSGFVRSSTRQIIRTASNVIYIFAVDDNVCQGGGSAVLRAYKGSGAQPADGNVPTSFAEVDAADHPVSAGVADCTNLNTSMLEDPDVKLDPSGIAHLAYIDEKTGDVYYQTFNTNTDLWGSRTVLAANGSTTSGASWPRTGQTGLTLDSNNVPWVVYATSGSSNSIQYTDMVGGSWSAPATIFSGTNEMHPSLATSVDGTLHLAWLDNSLATQGAVKYAHYSASAWGTVETVSSGDAVVLANGDDDQGPTVATDTSNRPHVLYMDGTVNGSNDYVRMRYRTSGGVWTDNTPPGGAGGASNSSGSWFAHTPGNYVSNANDDYVFLGHDVNIQFGYQYQIGGPGNSWGAYTTLDPRSKTNPAAGDTCEPGLDGAASVRFDPLRDNNPAIIDVAYYDERDNTDCTHHHATIYYKAIDIISAAPSGPAANIWVSPTGSDTGMNCARSATPIADPGSGECASFQKAYSLAACGDVVGVKAGNYSSQTISSGTKSCTSSTQVLFTSVPGGSCTDNTTVSMNSINISVAYVKVQCMNANPTGDTSCSGISGSSGQHTRIIWNTWDHMAIHCAFFDSDHMSITNTTFGPDNTCQTTLEDLTDFRANSDNINDVTFDYDTFETVTAPPDFECGVGKHVDSMQGYGIANLTIKNTNFYGCPGQCIIFRPYAGGIPGPITFENDFFNQAQSPGQAIDLGSSTSTDGDACNPGTILIENNTFENGAAVHGGFWSGGCSVIFRNNIMTNSSCGFGGSYATYSYNVIYSGATCGSNAKICTPSYAASTTSLTSPGNFSLTPGDTCAQNAADPANYPSADFYGTTRPQGSGPDIGAMEVAVTGSCPTGDVNGDCHVTLSDLSILLSYYGTTNSTCDLNKNGTVDIFDLSILLSHYGQ